jgi:hypothetical protein
MGIKYDVQDMYTWRITRAGLNGISTCSSEVFSQSMIFSTSSFVIWDPSQFRIADSRSTRTAYGNLSGKGQPSTGLSAVIFLDVRSIKIVFASWKQQLRYYYYVPSLQLHHYLHASRGTQNAALHIAIIPDGLTALCDWL